MSDDLGFQLGMAFMAVITGILVVVGAIATVTDVIPHLGHHHHAPSTLGYIAAYAIATFIFVAATSLVIGLARMAWQGY